MATVRQRHPEYRDDEIVEKGDTYFIHRPRVSEGEAEGLEDIQRFFIVLKPKGGARSQAPTRSDRHERIWGFIGHIVHVIEPSNARAQRVDHRSVSRKC